VPVAVQDRVQDPVVVQDRVPVPVAVQDRVQDPVVVQDRVPVPVAAEAAEEGKYSQDDISGLGLHLHLSS
jgi:hypothetical protein